MANENLARYLADIKAMARFTSEPATWWIDAVLDSNNPNQRTMALMATFPALAIQLFTAGFGAVGMAYCTERYLESSINGFFRPSRVELAQYEPVMKTEQDDYFSDIGRSFDVEL